jgi:hypothetical protein
MIAGDSERALMRIVSKRAGFVGAESIRREL